MDAQTLAQSIYEDQRLGHSLLTGELLHELIRKGNKVFTEGVGQVQARVEGMVRGSVDRLSVVAGAREEMNILRQKLAELEGALADLEGRARKRTRKKAN